MLDIFRGVRPDITPAQVIALVGAIVGALVAFGVDLSQDQQDSVLQLTAIVAGILLVSDAGLRAARGNSEAKKAVALVAYDNALDKPTTPDGDDTQAERKIPPTEAK